jgi:cytochrome c oxidase subunit 2
MRVHAYERAFLSFGAGLLVVFAAALAWATLGMGMHLPGRAGRVDPASVMRTPPFDHPGVTQTGPGEYQAVLIGYTWGFQPAEIDVPSGAEVTFIATSTDVIHGFEVEGTRVNMMLIPGQVSRLTYRFRGPGEHLLICHEYCGLGHQTMHAKVVVQ